jgi:hypothetical protein
MLKVLLVLCNLLVFVLPAISNAKGENNVLLDKPYFTIYLESTNMFGPIELNRQLLSLEERGKTEVELPVNQYIKSGENELSVLLVTDDPDNKKYKAQTHVKMTLRVRPSGSDPQQNITLATLEFSGAKANTGVGIEGDIHNHRLNSKKDFSVDQKGDILIGDVTSWDFQQIGDVVSRKITLPAIGLPRWAFFDSDDITNVKGDDVNGLMSDDSRSKLVAELLPIYTSIWNALKSKNITPILPLFEERNREYDAAFYRKPGTTARMLADALKESATEPDRKLFPITSDNIEPQVYDNDKLARLMQNSEDGLIGLNYVGGGSEVYDIILRKKNGRWIITR